MQVFGIFFQTHLGKKFVSHRTSASRETSFGDPKGGSRIEHLRRVVMRLGNVTQENLQDSTMISKPAVNLAHSSSSTNAKGVLSNLQNDVFYFTEDLP